MKMFKNDKCYVYLTDIVRYPTPNYLKLDVRVEESFLVVIDDPQSIEYIRNRKDILDYSEISKLSQEELSEKYKDAKDKLNRYAKRMLDTPSESRGRLYKDEEYMNNYKLCRFLVKDLSDYIINRDYIDKRFSNELFTKKLTLLRGIQY